MNKKKIKGVALARQIFGDGVAIGKLCGGITPQAVFQWRRNVPHKHCAVLVAEAHKKGYVEITERDFRGD